MKIKSFVVLGALAGAGAFVVKRWKHLEEQERHNDEKKLITLNSEIENDDISDESTTSIQEIEEESASTQVDEEESASINKYPHLTEDFVEAMMTQKDLFNLEYTAGNLIRVYHQIVFPNMNLVDYFLKEISEQNYEFDVNVESCVVKLAKNMIVENDMILNDIFHVADVAAGFEGNYKGYSVEIL